MLALWPMAAVAQGVCSPRTEVVEHLAKKYGEALVAAGLTDTGFMIELLRTLDGRTWTIIVTTPHGMSCLVTAGEGWRRLRPPGPHLGPRL